jgi:hypothetical protein
VVLVRALLICPWFGPFPPWFKQYRRNISRLSQVGGFDVLIDNDLKDFRGRVRERLGIECPITARSGKIHDYRAALGELYSEAVEDYDWWGHTDFDCVYGRVEDFYNDESLAELDVTTDCFDYICGPWTLYRPALANAFREYDGWQEILEDPHSSGWVEDRFTYLLNRMSLRIEYHQRHAFGDVQFLKRGEDGALLHFGREIPFFHFNRTKVWPFSQASQS